jgi:hypothetical protein
MARRRAHRCQLQSTAFRHKRSSSSRGIPDSVMGQTTKSLRRCQISASLYRLPCAQTRHRHNGFVVDHAGTTCGSFNRQGFWMHRPRSSCEIIEIHITNCVAKHSLEVLPIVTTRLTSAKEIQGISDNRTGRVIPFVWGIWQNLPFAGYRIDPVKPSLCPRIMAIDDTADNINPAITMHCMNEARRGGIPCLARMHCICAELAQVQGGRILPLGGECLIYIILKLIPLGIYGNCDISYKRPGKQGTPVNSLRLF